MTLPTSGPLTFSDIQTEFGGSNPIAMNEYYAGGGLVPAGTSGTYGTVPSSGALSVQNFYGTSALIPIYIEDVFSTYLYTGNGSTQTITNGIDLSTKGGLVWIKNRLAAEPHQLFDTTRGLYKNLNTNSTAQQFDQNPNGVSAFNSNGFSVTGTSPSWNQNNSTQVSWTFRKQPKFFDIVTYTGNGGNQTISHNLGSVPGCIIIKLLSDVNQWHIYHRSLGNNQVIRFSTSAATAANSTYWQTTTPTSTEFYIGSLSAINGTGSSYVAYVFAHDAGGFGLTGTDNVISCGSYTGTGATLQINLGYEAQWVMIKRTNSSGSWRIYDTMRGADLTTSFTLLANTSGAETNQGSPQCAPYASGFVLDSSADANTNGGNYIYIAIRRGPMKVPTVGTNVFKVETYNQTSASDPAFNLGKVADMGFRRLNDFESNWTLQSRLTGNGGLVTNTTAAESTQNYGFWDNMVGWYQGAVITPPYSQANWYGWTFARAPSFFDEVCYTGTGSATTVTHNLTVAPQMMIIKRRSSGADWTVYHVAMGASKYTFLDGSTELSSATIWNATTPTASVFSVGPEYYVNYAANTYVAYLFTTLAGISKVGSYTGTGALQTVNCGFTTGARFVLIHRIDSGSNNWFVYDSARGITSGDDPYLALNSTAAEVTGTNYVDTTSVGFQVTAAAPSGLNASGGTYIFLAIA